MPRIKANKREYMIKDFSSWLVGKMWEQGLKQKDVAEWLDCTQQNFSLKLKNHSFTLEEIIIIFHKLNVTEEEASKLLLY